MEIHIFENMCKKVDARKIVVSSIKYSTRRYTLDSLFCFFVLGALCAILHFQSLYGRMKVASLLITHNETSNSRTRIRKTFLVAREICRVYESGWFLRCRRGFTFLQRLESTSRSLRKTRSIEEKPGKASRSAGWSGVERVREEKSEKTNICRNSVRFMEAVSYQSLTLATLPLFLSLLPSLFTFLLAFFFPSEVFHQRASCDGKFPTPSKRLRGRVNANPPSFPEERAVFFIFRLHWRKIF